MSPMLLFTYHETHSVHLRSEPSVEEAVRAAMDEHNRPLHVYVNCAGVQGAC